MKGFKTTYLFVFVFLSISLRAQEVKLDTYKFGEGLNFSTDDGYTMRITGYLQPYMETKTFTDFDENSTQNRFRMRRIRLRFDGKLKNERFVSGAPEKVVAMERQKESDTLAKIETIKYS